MSTVNVNLAVAANTLRGIAGIGLRGTLTMAGNNYLVDNQNIGTSNEPITMGDVTGDNALCILRNEDSTNFITVFTDNGNTYQATKLLPGQFCVIFKTTDEATLYARADAATCLLSKVILESVTVASLAQYVPAFPGLGKFKARFALSCVLDGNPVSVLREVEENCAVAGLVNKTVGAEFANLIYESDYGLVGGTADEWGWVCVVNPNTTSGVATVLATDNLNERFSFVPLKNGFVLLPVNAAATQNLAGGAYEHFVLATRLDTPA